MNLRILQLGAGQLISPFGPGAIVDILGESFITATGDWWPKRTSLNEVASERLASVLGVQGFFAPPTPDDTSEPHALGIRVARFPSWLFCQNCRQMLQWTAKHEQGTAPACPSDGGRLVPMRFVVVCRDKSHAADVPWREWVHRPSGASANCKDATHLRFHGATHGSPGLSGLQISCDACGTSRTLGELRGDVLSREGLRCHGTQPWDREWRDCDSPLEVLQRGATNFHYGEVASAIDIPRTSLRELTEDDRIRLHPLFPGLKALARSNNATALASMIAAELGVDTARVSSLAEGDVGAGAGVSPSMRSGLLADEYDAFVAATRDAADEVNFKTRAVTLDEHSTEKVERALASVFDSIILVDKLREVRAVVSFARYRPDADMVPSVTPSQAEASWLPAAQGFGEGIFFRLRTSHVDAWAASAPVQRRVRPLQDKLATSRFGPRLHPASPQYVALHALAHALLREFSFSSGYTAASLRERIYSDDRGRHGVFIYTTSGDEEGTLGGLVREGETDRVGTTLARAIEQLTWCSNDPVCAESHPHNLDGLNLAACHACLLASETSCEGSNLLLDRQLLVGGADVPGLLDPITEAIYSA